MFQVLDGYTSSTKDSTHQKRSGKMSQTIDTKKDNPCPINRNTFFLNYTNKEKFVTELANHLAMKLKVVQCPSDADTSIVKEALTDSQNSEVAVFSDDTDVLYLLVHHVANSRLFLTNMTRKKHKQRERVLFCR